MYLMGVDIGTQSTKVVITNEKGEIKSGAVKEYNVLTPYPLWAEQWPEVWLEAAIQSIKSCLEKSNINKNELAGIAISGLYGGSGIAVDKNFKPLRPCIIWMDRRAQKEVEWVKKNIEKNIIFEITGNYVDSYYGFTKMLWIKNNEPEVWLNTFKFITPKDYIIYKFTNNNIIDYSSAGNIGGLLDINKKKWSTEMCKELGIDIKKLPEVIVKSSDMIGKVNKEYANKTGLIEGTPVIAGGIDAPVAQLSGGSVNEGEHVAMVGTSMCWGNIHDGRFLSPELISYPYVVKDTEKIYTFGGGATSGAILRWFRDEFCNFEKEIEEKSSVSAYKFLDLQAMEIKAGSEGLLILPYFMGERTPIWDPKAKGLIIGLSLYHKKPHIYKAFMEAIAYSLRHNIEQAQIAGIPLNNECILVGGAAKSDLWASIFADVTGFSMRRVKNDAEAALGDAFLAGLGTNIFKKPEEIKTWIKLKEDIIPVNNNKKIYDKYFDYYKKLYSSTRDIMWELR